MTQPPVDILLRIERLLDAGRQQEARILLVEYLIQNPASAHAWWLMSLTITDPAQQMDCLKRVLVLDPNNEPARQRLAELTSQPRVLSSVNPFAASGPIGPDEIPSDSLPVPAWAAPDGVVPELDPQQPALEQSASIKPPDPGEADGKAPSPLKTKKKWGLAFILIIIFFILGISFLSGKFLQQRAQTQAQVQAQTLSRRGTIDVAQILTNLPRPTLIPTWTATPTQTALPTSTSTGTPTPVPTLQYTLTKTPHPSSLIGPVVSLYAPDINLTELATGQQVTLGQFDGQPLLLFFWATWCPHCKNEINSIETIAETYKGAGLVVLAINAAEDPATVGAFQSAHLLTFPILLDPDKAVQALYHVDAIPKHFFVSSSGRIAFIGWGEMTFDEMKVQVDAIMRRYPTATP